MTFNYKTLSQKSISQTVHLVSDKKEDISTMEQLLLKELKKQFKYPIEEKDLDSKFILNEIDFFTQLFQFMSNLTSNDLVLILSILKNYPQIQIRSSYPLTILRITAFLKII